MRLQSILGPAVFAAISCTDTTAPCALTLGGGHVAYGIGGAVGERNGFRQGLDLGIDLADMRRHGTSGGMGFDSGEGMVLAATSHLGFGKYPTFVGAEVGIAGDTSLAGLVVAGGPAVRVDPTMGYGLGLRIAGDAFFLQAGLHLYAVVAPRAEAQLTFTIGIGRF